MVVVAEALPLTGSSVFSVLGVCNDVSSAPEVVGESSKEKGDTSPGDEIAKAESFTGDACTIAARCEVRVGSAGPNRTCCNAGPRK